MYRNTLTQPVRPPYAKSHIGLRGCDKDHADRQHSRYQTIWRRRQKRSVSLRAPTKSA